MRWAYVYQNDLGLRSANLKQTLNTVVELSKKVDLKFLCTSLTEKNEKFILHQYGIELGNTALPLGIELKTGNLVSEFKSRYQFNRSAVQRLRREKFDIVYTRDFGFLFYLWLTGQRKKIPSYIVYEPHKVYHRASSKVMRFMEAGAQKQCDALMPITEGLLQDLRSEFSLAQPARVLPDGVRIVPQAQKNEMPLDGPVRFIYAGSFKKWKGLDTLIQSMQVLEERSANLHLTICGGTESEVERLGLRCREMGLQNRVTLRGFLNDEQLHEEYLHHHAAVLPNTRETISARYTSPLKLFEYLAYGLPIVASDLPSLKEVLQDENALFFDSEDSVALANAMGRLAKDQDLRRRMSVHNAAFAKQFTWEHRAENLVNFVHEQL